MNGCKLMVSVGEHLHTEVYQVWNMWTVNWNTVLITLQEHNNMSNNKWERCAIQLYTKNI
jgi:hypothetical protein